MDAFTQPTRQFFSRCIARRDLKYKALLFVGCFVDLEPVQHEEYLHGGVPDSLVAIDEAMTLHEGEP